MVEMLFPFPFNINTLITIFSSFTIEQSLSQYLIVYFFNLNSVDHGPGPFASWAFHWLCGKGFRFTTQSSSYDAHLAQSDIKQ